jgi:L-asparaginase
LVYCKGLKDINLSINQKILKDIIVILLDKMVITFLLTGGTIDKSYDEKDGSLRNRDSQLEQIIVKYLRYSHLSFEFVHLMSKDSLELTDEDRDKIFKGIICREMMGNPIIVIHGTDRLQQTYRRCYGYKYVVPVIFTGAMRPFEFRDSDALQNITEAVILAQALNPGLYLSFHGQLFRNPMFQKDYDKKTFVAAQDPSPPNYIA